MRQVPEPTHGGPSSHFNETRDKTRRTSDLGLPIVPTDIRHGDSSPAYALGEPHRWAGDMHPSRISPGSFLILGKGGETARPCGAAQCLFEFVEWHRWEKCHGSARPLRSLFALQFLEADGLIPQASVLTTQFGGVSDFKETCARRRQVCLQV